MRVLGCGHGHYDKGHCGEPGCDNDFRRCPECNPPSASQRDADRPAGRSAESGDRPAGRPRRPW
jgi:hypothetical protein